MAIAINFDKAKIERILESISKGRPIGGIESVDDMLALGGACFFMAMSHGEELLEAVDWSKVPGGDEEPDEQAEDTFIPEIHAAIEYYAQLIFLVAKQEYDEHFDRRHKAIVLIEEGEKTVIPVEGMKSEV
jgi:hypothetical protein